MAVLAVVECVGLFLAFYLAAEMRFLGDNREILASLGEPLPRAFIFAATLSLALASLGLYQSFARDTLAALLTRVLVAFVLGGLVLMIAYYLLPTHHTGRGVLALALAAGFGMVVGIRTALARSADSEAVKRRVLVLGAGRRARLVLDRLRRAADRRNIELVGFVPVGGDEIVVPERQRISIEAGIKHIIERHAVDEVVVGPDDRRGTLPMAELIELKLAGVSVVDLVSFFERELGKLKLQILDPSWLVFSEGFAHGQVHLATKRAFDVIAAAVGVVLALPLMLGTALAIILESGWRAPIFYRQERVGEGGRLFKIIKFRSMRTDAEKDGVARWATANDDRVTRVGRVIRKLRFDELPQLFNVLRGEMSLVGPRPERPAFVAELSRQIPYYNLRHFVKPGVTGWAQLRYPYGASVEDAVEKLKFDLYYAKNQSLLFDALIALQTVEVVLFGKGSR
jgi:sugar transferase (PEP-CTERM system associated)